MRTHLKQKIEEHSTKEDTRPYPESSILIEGSISDDNIIESNMKTEDPISDYNNPKSVFSKNAKTTFSHIYTLLLYCTMRSVITS